jgi:hypothetical protein
MRGFCAEPCNKERELSDRTKVATQAENILLVPLNQLKKSPKNVRKIPRTQKVLRIEAVR